MRKRRKALILIICLLAVAAAGTPAGATLREGARVPQVSALRDLDGNAFEAGGYSSGRLLVCFFSIYSENAADLAALMERLNEVGGGKKNGVRVIGVNMDPAPEAVRKFTAKQKTSYRVLLDLSLEVSEAFQVRRMPTFYFLENGSVAQVFEGFSNTVAKRVTTRFEAWAGGNSLSGEEAKKRILAASDVKDVRLSPSDPDRMFFLSTDGILWSYDIPERERKPLVSDVSSFDVSPDGGQVVFTGADKDGVWIRSVDRGAPRRIGNTGSKPAWSPRGDIVAYLVGKDQVWVYNIAREKRWRVDATGVEVSWTSDGRYLLVRDVKNRLWQVSPEMRYSLIRGILR